MQNVLKNKMGDINFMDLTVEDIKVENGRVSIKAGGNFYSFFQTKRDGQPSRAQTDFEKLGLEVGKTYSFGVTENSKINEDGQTMVFRNICLISETRAPQGGPAAPQAASNDGVPFPSDTPPEMQG